MSGVPGSMPEVRDMPGDRLQPESGREPGRVVRQMVQEECGVRRVVLGRAPPLPRRARQLTLWDCGVTGQLRPGGLPSGRRAGKDPSCPSILEYFKISKQSRF